MCPNLLHFLFLGGPAQAFVLFFFQGSLFAVLFDICQISQWKICPVKQNEPINPFMPMVPKKGTYFDGKS